jgi:hypothetical protein
MAIGAGLILAGLFWPGAIVFVSATVVYLIWDVWSRRKQARFDSIARAGD